VELAAEVLRTPRPSCVRSEATRRASPPFVTG